MAQYQCSEIGPKDHSKITALVTPAGHYEALMIRQAALAPSAHGGWWYGAWTAGELHAVAWVLDSFANIHAINHESARALGDSMARAVGGRISTGGTHQVFGPEDIIDTFWQTFKGVKRTLVADLRRELFSLSQAPAPKEGYNAFAATAKESKTVEELCAEQMIEDWGVDPRRTAKQAHEAHCKMLIDEKRALLGQQKGKIVFFGEKIPHDSGATLLERLYVPLPFRRPRVLSGILSHLAALTLKDTKELLSFVDLSKEVWVEAFKSVDFTSKGRFRLLRLR